MGPKGRWRGNLINKIISSGKALDKAITDASISPVVRQTLQHWGYQVTKEDVLAKKA